MDIMMCQACGHYQNSVAVDLNLIYEFYLSRPSTTNPVLSTAFKEYADYLLNNFSSGKNLFAVEAGSNDGAFINYMKNTLKIKVLGVEPSENLSAQANNNNIPTIKRYFNFQTAKEIKEKYGSASFFIANHTFSNVIDLSDFVDGVKHLLKEDGVFSMQTHYIKAVVEKNLIENFAHEHLSGFYVKPLKSFFERKGMEIFDVKIVPAKHGSIRCLIQKKNGPNKILPSVKEVIKQEEVFGMDKFNRHDSIAKFIKENKQKIHDYIDPILQKGGKIAAYGTSTGATTFSFNYDFSTFHIM